MKIAYIPLLSSRPFAIVEIVFVSIIWASSFVIVKILIADNGPLTIAGLRYFLGFLVLLPWIVRQSESRGKVTNSLGRQLALMGIAAYTIGNGALFLALTYLPATTTSFLMSLTPILVVFGGIFFLQEIPTHWQYFGVVICVLGSVLFFLPGMRPGEPLGIVIIAVGLLGFAVFSVLGRDVARERRTSTIILTGVPLAVGGAVLLLIAIPLEGWPVLDLQAWAIVFWLAIFNTTFAYILYNHALKSVTALEMNVLLNMIPLITALFAWFILDESLAWVQFFGMLIVIAGVALVQVAGKRETRIRRLP